MASDKYESDKQHFRCVPPCPRFVTGGDTHNCVVCLGAEHARSALKGDCPHCVHLTMRSVPGERSLRSALSPVLPTVRVPPLPRQSGALNHGDHRWIWQKDWRRARPFLLLPLPDLALTLWRWKHILKRFPPPRERARARVIFL